MGTYEVKTRTTIYIFAVQFLTNLYIDGEDTFTKYNDEKIVNVQVNREQYRLSEEAKLLFAQIHDDWEINVCKQHQSDVLLSGRFQYVYIAVKF